MRSGDAGRERIQRGVVTRVAADSSWGRVVDVRLADGRVVPAQPWFPGSADRGDYYEVAEGDIALCLPVEGLASDWVALVGGGSDARPVPADATNSVRAVYGSRVEVRRAADKDVEAVLLRELLDDLHSLLSGLQALVTALTNPATPPGTAAQNAAILTAMRAAADVPSTGLSSQLVSMLAALATSKAGTGALPYCSPALHAQRES